MSSWKENKHKLIDPWKLLYLDGSTEHHQIEEELVKEMKNRAVSDPEKRFYIKGGVTHCVEMAIKSSDNRFIFSKMWIVGAGFIHVAFRTWRHMNLQQ